MPEFILDHGSPEATRVYNSLDDFTQGYIEAMYFTNTGSGDDADLEHATFGELALEALNSIVADCARFQTEYREDLDEALDNGRVNGYDKKAAGRDFWYSRNHHGCGFWDRNLGDVGNTLTELSHNYPERSLYRDDKGAIALG